MTKFLLLTCMLVVHGVCSPATHPRFAKMSPIEIVDSGSWDASYGTSIRGLPEKMTSPSNGIPLNFVIEHLPNKTDFELVLRIRCSPGTAEQFILRRSLPFEFTDETLCPNELPVALRTTYSTWLEIHGDIKYRLQISLYRASSTPPGLDFEDTFSHNIRLQFGFSSSEWSLETNSLYLWNWDSAFTFSNANSKHAPQNAVNYFLTDAAIDLMTQMKVPDSKRSFDSIQFIEPSFVQLLRQAPEYTQSYINIEAIMLMGFGIASSCQTSRPEYTNVFASRKAGDLFQHDLMLKVAHLDWRTGRLTFSPHGLSAAMVRFNEHNRKQLAQRWASSRNNYILRICAGIELAHHMDPVTEYRSVMMARNPQLNYRILGTPESECVIVGSSTRQVTFFSISGINQLICPIICSNYKEPYVFSRGEVVLTPNLMRDRMGYINDSVFAYKAGTAIEIRGDLTHEDAGQYKCSAGGKTVTFEVSVLAMPRFTTRLLSGAKLNGELPLRVYAMEGEGYSLQCTVFFSGLRKPALLEPVFYLRPAIPLDGKYKWTKSSWTEFANKVKSQSQAEIFESSDSYSKTIQLSVSAVPGPYSYNRAFFDHQLSCNAAASTEDASRYGLSDFSTQSIADVHFVPRPRLSDFNVSVSDCCLRHCLRERMCNEVCSVRVALNRDVRNFLEGIGLTVETEVFPLPTFAEVTLKSAEILIKIPDACSMEIVTAKEHLWRQALTFRYKHSIPEAQGDSFRVIRSSESSNSDDQKCLNDRTCLFSTRFDEVLRSRLTVAGLLSEFR